MTAQLFLQDSIIMPVGRRYEETGEARGSVLSSRPPLQHAFLSLTSAAFGFQTLGARITYGRSYAWAEDFAVGVTRFMCC